MPESDKALLVEMSYKVEQMNAVPQDNTHTVKESEETWYGSENGNEQTIRYESLGKDIHKDMKKIQKLSQNLGTLPDAPSEEHKAHIAEVLGSLNTEFLNEVNLFLNTEAEKSSGVFDTKKMSMYLNLNTKTKALAGNAKSAMEVHAHELIHAFTAYALSLKSMVNHTTVKQLWNLFHLAEKHVTWEHFLPEDSIDPKREEEIAKATYTYIFNNKEGKGLHEFIAHGLTNEQLVTFLKTVDVSDSFNETEQASSILGLLKNLWESLMSLVMNNVKSGQHHDNVYEALLGLTLVLSETNNKAINRVMKNDGLFTSIFRMVDSANKKGENLVKKVEKYIDNKGIPQIPINASVLQQAYFLTKYSYKLIADPKLRPELEQLMTALGIDPEGMITNILKDMRSSDTLDDAIERLGYANGKIEEEKVLIEKVARGYIHTMFKEKLSRKAREVLSLGVLDIDLESLTKHYSSEQISVLLKHTGKRELEIARIEAILHADKAFGKWYTTQAKGLGVYMATHEAGIIQNYNAEGIVRLVHSGHAQTKPSSITIKHVDILATLYGISYNSKEINNEVARLMDSDPEGMNKFLNYHHVFKTESKKTLFKGNEALMIKGYAAQLSDNTVSVQVMPLSIRAEMENEGYELVSEVNKSSFDTSVEPMGVYKSKAFVALGYSPGVTRITDLGRRGTTLGDIRFKGSESYRGIKEATDIAILKRQQREIAKEMLAGTYDRVKDIAIGLSPVITGAYQLHTFRYMMSKKAKRDLLEQDIDGVDVLARMHSNMYDKSKTEEQNNKVLKVIKADMDANYVAGEVYGHNRREYVKITEDSHIEEIASIYKLLPKSFKEAVDHEGYTGIAVRRDMLHAYFGFKEATILNAGALGIYFNGVAPKEIQDLTRVVEGYWKELIKISKVDIIIRTPGVLLSNIVSNAFYSVQSGNNPIKVIKRTASNFVAVHEYIQLRNNHELQVQKGKNGEPNAKRKARNLQAQMEEHPLHELMESGLYQAVQTEDIGQEDFKTTNKISKKVESVGEGVPGFIKEGLHWIYLSEKTQFFKMMTLFTQYSDVVARVTEYQFLREQGVLHNNALKTVINAFVNYNKISSAKEDWLNKIGLLMFTKYFKRTQRALQYLIEKKPVSFVYSMLLQEATVDVPDVSEQSIWTKNYGGLVHNPLDNIANAITPTSVELILGSDDNAHPFGKPLKYGDDIKLYSQFRIVEGPLKNKHIIYHPKSTVVIGKGPEMLLEEGETTTVTLVGHYKDVNIEYYTVEILDADGVMHTTQQNSKRLLYAVTKGSKTEEYIEDTFNKVKKIARRKFTAVSEVVKGKYSKTQGKSSEHS